MNADCLLHDLPAHRHRGPILPPPPSTIYHQRSVFYPQEWRTQPAQSSLFAAPLGSSSWNNAGPSHPQSLWPNGPPEFLLPFHHYSSTESDRASFSVTRSDTSSAVSRDSDLSPSPEVAQVVCNAPLVAPIPLPYHSPTFLLYDLPDDDEDYRIHHIRSDLTSASAHTTMRMTLSPSKQHTLYPSNAVPSQPVRSHGLLP